MGRMDGVVGWMGSQDDVTVTRIVRSDEAVLCLIAWWLISLGSIVTT